MLKSLFQRYNFLCYVIILTIASCSGDLVVEFNLCFQEQLCWRVLSKDTISFVMLLWYNISFKLFMMPAGYRNTHLTFWRWSSCLACDIWARNGKIPRQFVPYANIILRNILSSIVNMNKCDAAVTRGSQLAIAYIYWPHLRLCDGV